MSVNFDWGTSELNKAHFNAFANLLYLRDGGQVDSASLPNDLLADDRDDEWDGASVDTNKAHQISDSGHMRLKRKFLDCLAELAANKKDWKTVSCTAMKEAEDGVTIWIARNKGFPEKDKAVFDKLSLLLSRLSCGHNSMETKAVKHAMWAEMVSYYQDRIQHYYVPNLRAAFKREDNVTHSKSTIGNHSIPANKLSMLRKLVFDAAATEHAKLVNCAYELRTSTSAEALLQDSSVEVTEKLWVEICLLARLRVVYKKFEEITSKLGSFNEVTIVLLPHTCLPVKPPENPLNLKQTFELLGLCVDSQTLKAVIRKSSVSGVNRDFTKVQKHKLQVHAEVEMLLFLCTKNPSLHGVLPYLGCSKLSCFLCARLLQYHGSFTSRGCHGRVFSQWTVPRIAGLVPQQCEKISQALTQLQKGLKKELKAPLKEYKPQQKTSVIGGSSVVTDHRAEGLQRKSDIKTWRLKAEQERVAQMFKRKTLKEEQPASQLTTVRTPERYSDKMEECDSLAEDQISEEEEVLEDFGFNHLPSFADKCKLFGLYQGLRSDKIGPEEVHKWRVEGTLVANIKDFYYKIPETHRGGYFPWFLNHTDILDRCMTKEESMELMLAKFFDKARPYLDPEDQNKDRKELKPEAKAHSYVMLAATLHMAHPHPREQNWHAFGFCTCNGEREEGILGGLYQALLIGDELFEDVWSNLKFPMPGRRQGQTATFPEFWQAFEAGKLIQLMDSKGLKDQRIKFPFLEEFLSVPPTGPWPSVWDLKQFVAIADPAEFPPSPAVQVDYGFMNCRTFEETCILMEIYKRLLGKANPLALHEACLAGKLFEFAGKFDKMDETHRRLMKNFYPLKEH